MWPLSICETRMADGLASTITVNNTTLGMGAASSPEVARQLTIPDPEQHHGIWITRHIDNPYVALLVRGVQGYGGLTIAMKHPGFS